MRERKAAYRMPHRLAPGERQMRLDLALLEWVSAGPDRLVFRTYSWDRPTLSLGRSEPFPGDWDAAALAREGIPVVRRPTGGNAVLHCDELTFAVAASIPGPWVLTPRRFAARVADALVETLRDAGVEAEPVGEAASGTGLTESNGSAARRAAAPSERARTPGDAPCFARSDRGEVQAGGFKVAGLASRFTRAGALCHASVPLTRRHREIARYRLGRALESARLEAHARSLDEILGAAPELSAVAAALETRIAACFGVSLREASPADLGIAA